MNPEDESEGECPGCCQSRSQITRPLAYGARQEARGQGGKDHRGEDDPLIRDGKGEAGEQVRQDEVEGVPRRVVDAEGVRGNHHFRAVDRVDGVQRPHARPRPHVDGERDAEGQQAEQDGRGDDAGSQLLQGIGHIAPIVNKMRAQFNSCCGLPDGLDGCALRSVFQGKAFCEQVVADAVGCGEVFLTSGFGR